MSFSVSPEGFDPDQKDEARKADQAFRAVGHSFAIGAVGAGIAFQPLAVGLALASAATHLLRMPFERISNDPPRDDFSLPVVARATIIDPTILGADTWQTKDRHLMSRLPGLTFGFDRGAAYLEAMLTAAERAMGAYLAQSGAAVDLRLAECRKYAHRARMSLATTRNVAFAVESSSGVGQLIEAGHRHAEQEEREQRLRHFWSLPDLLGQEALAAVRMAGIDDLDLFERHVTGKQPARLTVGGAVQRALEFTDALASGMPSTREFISEGEEAHEWSEFE